MKFPVFSQLAGNSRSRAEFAVTEVSQALGLFVIGYMQVMINRYLNPFKREKISDLTIGRTIHKFLHPSLFFLATATAPEPAVISTQGGIFQKVDSATFWACPLRGRALTSPSCGESGANLIFGGESHR
jgi:hypothetical protein